MVESYKDRPRADFEGGWYVSVASLCFTNFLSNHYGKTDTSENDSQPEILSDDIIVRSNAVLSIPGNVF